MSNSLNSMQETPDTIAADPEHIAISKSTGIKIDWRDGHHSDYSLAYLRDECPCASCTGAHGTEPQKSQYSKSGTVSYVQTCTADEFSRGGGKLCHSDLLE